VVVDRSKRGLRELNGKVVVARVDDGIVVKYLNFNPKLDHMHALLVPHNAREHHAVVSSPKDMEESVIGKVVLAISLMK
jgi:hypothetical protein